MEVSKGQFYAHTLRAEKNRPTPTYRCRSRCGGVLKIIDGDYVIAKEHSSNCNSSKDLDLKTRIVVGVKDALNRPENKWLSARAIVEPIVNTEWKADPTKDLLKMDNVIRIANRVKAGRTPKHPADLDFKIESLPDNFLVADIKFGTKSVDLARHVVFATPYMMELFAGAIRLYMDGTFSPVKEPFQQLFTIHCSIKKGDQTRNVPVCYITMSGIMIYL